MRTRRLGAKRSDSAAQLASSDGGHQEARALRFADQQQRQQALAIRGRGILA